MSSSSYVAALVAFPWGAEEFGLGADEVLVTCTTAGPETGVARAG